MTDRDHRSDSAGGTIHVATFVDQPPDPNLAVVTHGLSDQWVLVDVRLSVDAAAYALRGDDARTFALFQHTPQPLVDAWLVARAVRAEVPPGGIVLMSDVGGRGGILAIEEAARRDDAGRRVWSAAGSSATLHALLVAGTIEHLGMPMAAAVDWELVQYRASEEVLATSEKAVELLAGLGVEASLATKPEPVTGAPTPLSRPSTVWIPGPVSREHRSGEVLRGLATGGALEISVSTEDATDEAWTGTTWETLAGVRRAIGTGLHRLVVPPHAPDLVVVGATLSPPDDDTRELRAVGTPVAVPSRSVAAAMWPDAPTWESSDDVAALVGGSTSIGAEPGVTDRTGDPRGGDRPRRDSTRAAKVSVGVPVFGSVDFLDACVESILAQTVPPHEVILMDDGSRSSAVDAALERWSSHPDGLIRTMRQPNRGVCVARNRMIDAMTGDAFVLVDQDDVVRPTFIERTRDAMRSDMTVLAVATWTEFVGAYEAIEAKPPFDRRVGLRENPIVSTAALVDIRVRDLGVAFAPDLAFLYCEDWHFWSQIIAAGGHMGLVPQPLVAHRVHRSSGGFQRTELALAIGTARATDPLRGAGTAAI